jgi:peroxiredoxin
MTMSDAPSAETRRSPLQPGDRAPEFSLPAADRDGTVSLADFRSRTPLLLGLFRGTYCPFCRQAIARMGQACDRLRAYGVEALAVVATTPENSRFYFRFRPPRMRVAADPEFATHRLYGVPAPWRADIEDAMRTTQVNPTRDLPAPLPVREASAALSRLEGFEPSPTDREDAARPFLQFLGQFLVDREGIIRWTNLECAGGGLTGLGRFPTDEELLAAVRSLPRS